MGLDYDGAPLPEGYEAWTCPECTAQCTFEAMERCHQEHPCPFIREGIEGNGEGGAFAFDEEAPGAHPFVKQGNQGMTFERNCDQCRGTGVSSLFAGRCFECGGTGQDPIARLLRTHEGACTLGERIAKKELDYEVLHARFKGSKVLLEALDKARTVSRNPCAHCGRL